MPLSLGAQGTVQARVPEGETLTLQASAQASGTHSGANAALDVQARGAPSSDPATATPTLLALIHISEPTRPAEISSAARRSKKNKQTTPR